MTPEVGRSCRGEMLKYASANLPFRIAVFKKAEELDNVVICSLSMSPVQPAKVAPCNIGAQPQRYRGNAIGAVCVFVCVCMRVGHAFEGHPPCSWRRGIRCAHGIQCQFVGVPQPHRKHARRWLAGLGRQI